MAVLTVVHTSDFHGHFPAAAIGKLRALKSDSQALLLDSGDALFLPQWLPYVCQDPIIQRMNQAGYDAVTAGNHEYFLRSRQAARRTAGLHCPVLCANLLRPNEQEGNLRRWTILQSPGGDSVGVFGLMPPMIPPGSFGERFSDMRFIPWEQAAREAVAALRPQVKWLIALLHIGTHGDKEIARACPEIDLILAGHSHLLTPEPEVCGSVTIVRSGCHGKLASIVRSSDSQSPSAFTQSVEEL